MGNENLGTGLYKYQIYSNSRMGEGVGFLNAQTLNPIYSLDILVVTNEAKSFLQRFSTYAKKCVASVIGD